MSDECKYCGKKQYSSWDHLVGQPKLDRIEENYKSILARGNVEDDVVLIRGNQQEFIKGFRKGAGLKDKEEINTTHIGSSIALVIFGIAVLGYMFW